MFPLSKGQPAHSGASSTHGHSHIKSLLMNLPSLGTTRGFSTEVETDESMDLSFDEDDDTMFSHPTKMVANSFVLGKGKAENLEFDWVITEWSACSQSCGGDGFQVGILSALLWYIHWHALSFWIFMGGRFYCFLSPPPLFFCFLLL